MNQAWAASGGPRLLRDAEPRKQRPEGELTLSSERGATLATRTVSRSSRRLPPMTSPVRASKSVNGYAGSMTGEGAGFMRLQYYNQTQQPDHFLYVSSALPIAVVGSSSENVITAVSNFADPLKPVHKGLRTSRLGLGFRLECMGSGSSPKAAG